MKESKKVYIFRNTFKGWGIIRDSKHIDTNNALFLNSLENAKHFCDINNLEVILLLS